MANSSKPKSSLDESQILQSAMNDSIKTISTDTFITGKIGYKIEKINTDSVTEDISYYDSGVLLLTLRVVYTDSTKEDFLSVERTA